MMKIRNLMLLYISVWFLHAEEPKFILAYQVDEREKWEEQLRYRRPSDPEEVGEKAVATKLKVAPFESRFFEEGDELWDLTHLARPRLNEYFFGSVMIFNETKGRLIVQGNRESHRWIKRVARGIVVCQMETKVRLVEVPGVSFVRRSEMVSDLPKMVKELAEVSCRNPENESILFESEESGWTLETKVKFDRDEAFIYYELDLKGNLVGSPFHLQIAGAVFPGLPKVVEIGSINGGKTLVAVLTIGTFLADGTSFDRLILSETEGAILERNRLRSLDDLKELPDLSGFRISCYRHPPNLGMPSLPLFVDGEDLDSRKREGILPFRTELPHLGGGKWTDLYDLTELMRNNGVSFEEGEFAVVRLKTRVLYLKSKGENLALADSVIRAYQSYAPEMIRVDVLEVESAERIDAPALRGRRFKIINKMGLTVEPGKVGALALSGKLAMEMEAYVDLGGEILEASLTFDTRKGDLENPISSARFVADFDVPIVLHQSRVGEKWRAFVAISSVIDVYGETRK